MHFPWLSTSRTGAAPFLSRGNSCYCRVLCNVVRYVRDVEFSAGQLLRVEQKSERTGVSKSESMSESKNE